MPLIEKPPMAAQQGNLRQNLVEQKIGGVGKWLQGVAEAGEAAKSRTGRF